MKGSAVEGRAVLAPEVFQKGAAALDVDEGMTSRDRGVLDEQVCLCIAPDHAFSQRQRNLASLEKQPESTDRCIGGHRSSNRSDEGVPESVHGADGVRLMSVVTQCAAQLRDQTGERGLGDEGAGPDQVMKFILGERGRRALDQDPEQLERFSGDVELSASLQKEAAIEVELMGSEEVRQGWASAGSTEISRFPEDFTLLLTDYRPRHVNPTSQALDPVDRQFRSRSAFPGAFP